MRNSADFSAILCVIPTLSREKREYETKRAWQISIVSFAIVVSNGVAAGGSASGEANMLFGVVHSADGRRSLMRS